MLAVSKWGAARRIGVPVVRIFALGAGSRSSPAGPVRGTLRLSPAQVLELDEVPPFILELHARAASATREEEGKKRGGKKVSWRAGCFGAGALVGGGQFGRSTARGRRGTARDRDACPRASTSGAFGG